MNEPNTSCLINALLNCKGSDRLTSTARHDSSRWWTFQGQSPVEREKASGDMKAAPRVRSGKDESGGTHLVAISTRDSEVH